jgi:hypothetical protein
MLDLIFSYFSFPICDRKIMNCEGLEPVIGLLSTNCETVLNYALTVLTNMACEDRLRDKIISCGVIPALVVLLSSK